MHPNLYQHLKQHGMVLIASSIGVHVGLHPLLATTLCFMHGCCMIMNNSLGICRYEWALKGFSCHIRYCQMCLCHYLVITVDIIRFTWEASQWSNWWEICNIQYAWYITTHVILVSYLFHKFKCFRINAPRVCRLVLERSDHLDNKCHPSVRTKMLGIFQADSHDS